MLAENRYIPALDGLRAVSILLVVVSHAGLDHVVPGAFGVTLFFFISGFLITRQLLAELQQRGRVDLFRFYLRRALRLMPVGISFILLAGLVFSLAGGRISGAGWAAALFYGANYYDLWARYQTTLPGVRHPFNILWSLAVEEHFYLIWPAVLALLARGRGAIPAVLTLCLAVLVWRFALFQGCSAGAHATVCGTASPNPLYRFARLYRATDTRLDSIAWGALLALAVSRGESWVGLAMRSRPLQAASLLLLAASFMVPGALFREVIRYSLQGVALLVLVPPALSGEGAVPRLLGSLPAVFLGRLSYSLYLWHWAAYGVADRLAPHNGARWLVIGTGLAACLSLAAYFGIERPMLRLRRRAGSHAPRAFRTEEPMPAAALAQPA